MDIARFPDLSTRNVIVTGASGNLGQAVIRVLLDKGYRVIAVVHRGSKKHELPAGEKLHSYAVDLSDEENTRQFVKTLQVEFEDIHAALMLAGGWAGGKISDTGIKNIREQLSLNFETAYNLSQALLPQMIDNNFGRLVFIGARPALHAAEGKNMVAYGLSKSLLFKLAEYINSETKGKNVTATVIVPSTIDTPSNRKAMPDSDPNKWVSPEQLATIIEFIISQKAAPLRETVIKVYNNSWSG